MSLYYQAKKFWVSPLGALIMATLGATSCGLFVDSRVLALAAALLCVMALGVAWPWLAMVSTRATLRFATARARENEAVELTIEMQNLVPLWGFSLRGVAANEYPNEHAFAHLPPSKNARLRVKFQPAQRGEYPHAAPQLNTGFPFGLWQARRGMHAENTLLVWPRTVEAGPLPLLPSRQRQEGLMFSNATGHGGDMMGVRDYQRGDSLRRIHWAQTARHDRLIVCEQQATQWPRVLVAIDLDNAAHSDGAAGTREWAIRIGASLCESWSRQGAQIEILWGAGGQSTARDLARVMDDLARIGTHDEGTLSDVVLRAAKRGDAALRVIITTDAALQKYAAHPALQHSLQGAAQHGTCFVVLKRQCFGGSAAAESLPSVPMIFLDDAQNVALQLRRGWEAISLA